MHAGITGASDATALKNMADKGVKIHDLTAEEQKMFRDAAQPAALEIIAKRIGQEWVDAAVKAVLAKGYRTPDLYTGEGILVGTAEMGRLISEEI